MLLPLLSEEAEATIPYPSYPRGSEDADVRDRRGRKANQEGRERGEGGKRRPRVEAPACSQPAVSTLGVLGACRLLAHSPGMCHLHPLLTSLSFASCLKRKPAQIWLQNLTDAFGNKVLSVISCLVQGIPTDPGVWY